MVEFLIKFDVVLFVMRSIGGASNFSKFYFRPGEINTNLQFFQVLTLPLPSHTSFQPPPQIYIDIRSTSVNGGFTIESDVVFFAFSSVLNSKNFTNLVSNRSIFDKKSSNLHKMLTKLRSISVPSGLMLRSQLHDEI